ncbi:sulfate permease, SulP family [Seinonella peptonophila]|uniref:Sulfate permease, SulP family n=1 Tax=Seinonella peptonophila TaxID=112248 RepID=A0A1M4ZNH8_9BACL|nr:SulP family inorganic anion transporter [Seinonella peptonophila]SHF19660.1 sulfate permease, SulP family [Seinonella peptonophila]
MREKMFTNQRFRKYSWSSLQRDLLAGVIVGIVAIPLAMAFAIASGVKPEYGIYTTIVAGFLAALFGGSRFQVVGPTGAFVPMLFGIVMQYGYQQLLIAGCLAGVILIMMGLFRLGTWIQFIPRPVTIGFTAGIAVIIFFGQISAFLGLDIQKQGQSFVTKLLIMINHAHTFDIWSLLTACICLTVILLLQHFWPKLPAPIIGLVLSASVAYLFYPGKVSTIGSLFGGFPSSLPSFTWLPISIDNVINLLVPAMLIAFLGGIESLLSAHVADEMSGDKHHSNRELIGQGIANVVTPFFGGIPATGAIARTATNIRSGAISPLSSMIHSLFVLCTLLFFAPFAVHVPLASMAPILMVVAWKMSERKKFQQLLQMKTSDSLVLCVTFLLTVLADLTIGVLAGIILSMLIFMIRMGKCHIRSIELDKTPSDIGIYSLEGPVYFGSVKQLMNSIQAHPEHQKVILMMDHVPYLDTTGVTVMTKIRDQFQDRGIELVVSGLRSQPKSVLMSTENWKTYDSPIEAIESVNMKEILTQVE